MFKIMFMFLALNGAEYSKTYDYIEFWSKDKCDTFINSPEFKLMIAQRFGVGNGIRLYKYECVKDGSI